MIKTLIVDDEFLARSELKHYLQEETDFSVIGEAEDGEGAIQMVKDLKPEVVFLDIHIPDFNGLKVAHILSEFQSPPVIVFVTAYDEYAIQAFETNALDYMLKPYNDARFKKVCNRIRSALKNKSEAKEKLDLLKTFLSQDKKPPTILGHKRGSKERVFIQPAEVLYFHVKLTEVTAHLTNGEELLVNATLKSLFEMLDSEKFKQTHRAYIVNLGHVQKLSPLFSGSFELILKGSSKKVPASHRYAAKLKKFLNW